MQLARHLIGLGSGALLVGSVVGLATRDDPAPATPSGPGAVTISGFAYQPDPIRVAVGSTVTWTNDDGQDHTVDGTERTAGLRSGSIADGGTYEHAFDTAGTYSYFCAFHPFMKGTIEVGP